MSIGGVSVSVAPQAVEEWAGQSDGRGPVLPADWRVAAEIFKRVQVPRGWRPGGMGPALPVAIDEARVERRARHMGFDGPALLRLVDRVMAIEDFWLEFEHQKISEEMKRNRSKVR